MAKFGRPSKYKPEYCELVLEHAKSGLTFESFAGVIGVHFDTLYEWAKIYPEFSEAKKQATALSMVFWDKLGRDGTMGLVKNFNTAAWIFNMKNRFKWRDSVEVTSADNGEIKKIQVSYKLDDK